VTVHIRAPILLALLTALTLAAPAVAQDCPTQSFLLHDGFVYASETLPGEPVAAGDPIGNGELDRPVSENGCERERAEVSILRAGEVDPTVAVAVEGAPGLLFVLGARCSGYEGDARRSCLLEPLRLDGRSYTGARYPQGARPRARRRAREGGARGEHGECRPPRGRRPDGRRRGGRAARGGIPGRRGLSVERFARAEADDDLRKCLEAPFWLVFDPLGARVGDEIVARSDRALPEAAAGATVSLVRLESNADALPPDLSGTIPIGTVVVDDSARTTLRFAVPDVEQGLYEAVVSCEACAEAFGGRTTFPAGSVIVFEGSSGSSGPRILFFAVGAAFVIALVTSVVLWRKGWRIGRRRRPDTGA
jgi:hypothetical protein